jgi:hypothetical protein
MQTLKWRREQGKQSSTGLSRGRVAKHVSMKYMEDDFDAEVNRQYA